MLSKELYALIYRNNPLDPERPDFNTIPIYFFFESKSQRSLVSFLLQLAVVRNTYAHYFRF